MRYGMGLQLVNLLRDLPEDLANGRCYLPVADPLDPAQLIPARSEWLKHAAVWLESGRRYAHRLNLLRLRAASVLLPSTLYDLPENYYEQYTTTLNAVTLEQANQAVAARLSDENLLVTVVGTEDSVGKDVRDAVANLASAKSVRYDTD